MQYLVAILHPDDYDPFVAEDEANVSRYRRAQRRNDRGWCQGFRWGLHPARSAKPLRAQPCDAVTITDGPYVETKDHVAVLDFGSR